MKLKGLKLVNFAKFSNFEVEFNGDVTNLYGINGAGKTTIGLTALQAGLRGIAASAKDGQLVGDRYRFIGPNKKSANIIITIVDEKKGNAEIVVSNRITEAGNSITFDAPDDYPLSHDWLNGLLNAAFLSAKSFGQLSSKEQALALGIDTAAIDAKIVSAKADITITNKSIKNIGALTPVEPKEKVSVSEMLKILNEIRAENDKIEESNKVIESVAEKTQAKKDRLRELEAEMVQLKADIAKGDEWLAKKSKQPTMPTAEIEAKIQDAEKINEEAGGYLAYKAKADELAQLQKALADQQLVVKKLEAERLALITGFNFGIEGLDVDSSGALMLNDRPIKEPYYSKGELEVIVAKLYASTNPELKVRFIDEFNTLDDHNQEVLLKELLNKGFQIITAQSGTTAKGQNSLLIREGKAIKEGDIV